MWLKVNVNTTTQHAENLADLLSAAGAAAVSFEDAGDQPLFQLAPQATPLWQDVRISALFDPAADIDSIIALIEIQLPEAAPLQAEKMLLEEQDWVRVTQNNFKPQCFGDSLWICPEWCNDEALHGTVVTLDPGLAFGTGNHATTALCLEWLAKHPPRDQVVIDYGCGSGILALAALALGASNVLACDHDPQAIQATRNNAELNGFVTERNFNVFLPEQFPAIAADVVVANILANPLVELAPLFTELTKAQGTLVLSGLLETEIEKVIAAYTAAFNVVQTKTQAEWALIELKKK